MLTAKESRLPSTSLSPLGGMAVCLPFLIRLSLSRNLRKVANHNFASNGSGVGSAQTPGVTERYAFPTNYGAIAVIFDHFPRTS
jgi:hypothetical protein